MDIFPKFSLFEKASSKNSLLPITSEEFLLGVLIFISAFVILWLAIRELKCWYWKINYRIKLQEEMNKNIKEIKELLLEYSIDYLESKKSKEEENR